MKNILFHKYTGAGNDFILIDFEENSDFEPEAEQIRKMCCRFFGIGADGVLLYNDNKANRISVKYYNADGLPGTFCGNGSRCILSYFCYKNKETDSPISFSFWEKSYSGWCNGRNSFSVNLNIPEISGLNLKIDTSFGEVKYDFINTGSPHIVVYEESLINPVNVQGNGFEAFALELRHHSFFAPGGVNVNLVAKSGMDLKIRTFERGVERETLACGSGTAAAAVSAGLKGIADSPVVFEPKSGSLLTVEFNNESGIINNLCLTGEANRVFSGTYYNTNL